MAIVNRDLDPSESKLKFDWASAGFTTVATGVTQLTWIVPTPGVLQSFAVAALGLSGAPQLDFFIQRFAGGATTIPLSISNMIVSAYGTSGAISQGYSGLQAAGSTLMLLQQGDIVGFHTSVANTAVQTLLLNMVMKKTQDIVALNTNST